MEAGGYSVLQGGRRICQQLVQGSGKQQLADLSVLQPCPRLTQPQAPSLA